jgi:glycerate 2-kinase
VPGDDPAVIASGPTVPDPTTFATARALLARYGIDPSPQVAARLASGEAEETPKPGSLPDVDFRMIATPMMALHSVAAAAQTMGLRPLILGDALEGEAREMGTVIAGIARSVRSHAEPLTPPCVLLSGGEGTVTIGPVAPGRGGRNTEFLLGLAVALQGTPGIWAVAGDTDGIDGTEDAAGALVTPDTIVRARAAGIDPQGVLAAHDSYGLFDAIGDLIRTGPTLTNVNDVRAVLIA